MRVAPRFFRHFVLRYWPYYLLGLGALYATNHLTVLVPKLIQESIDALEVNHDASTAINRAAWILPVAVAIIVVRTTSRQLFFNPGRAIEFNLKNRLYRHLQDLPQRFFDQHPVGDLTSRATNDMSYVRALVGFAGLQVFNVAFATPMTLWRMWSMSPDLTLRTLVPLLVVSGVLYLSIRLLSARMRQSLEQLSALSDHILETYNAVPTVQGWNAMPAFFSRYETLNDAYTNTQIYISAVRSVMMPFVFLISTLAVIGAVWFGGQDVIAGELTVGVIAAFASYIGLLVGQFMSFGWTLNVLQRGWLSLVRIYDILDAPLEAPGDRAMPPRLPGPRGVMGYRLEVRGLDFSYPKTREESRGYALRDLAFTVEPGQTLGVFGPTGSGKTTLIQLLARIYEPPRDTVKINGVDVLDIDLTRLREVVALVPQDPFLFSRSLRENIVWSGPGAEDAETALERSIRMACLTSDVQQLPTGLDTVVGARGITLSGGQRQRTALARAFHRPYALLLLDDVLSAVDHTTEQRLIEHIYEAAVGQTTVLVAHRLSVLQHADQILVLDQGRVIDCAPHAVLLERCPMYAETWRVQQEREPGDAPALAAGVIDV